MEAFRFDRGKLRSIIREIDGYLEERDQVREKAIRLSRDIVRYSGWSVTSVHKGDMDAARRNLREAEDRAIRLLSILKPYPELYYSGIVNNAVSEYVEAKLLLSLLEGRGLPGPEELGVPPVPYLQGLGDLVGELRRLALELVRRGNYSDAWRLVEAMEAIYLELRGLDYPEALAPGVRHKADVARRLVDDTKAFLVDMESRAELSSLLRRVQGL
ncbi:MAG: haloacid dehalogenase [Desulfurococcales archaeon]|nr:haloacid dehalogenase [Desulfurococcales archaeon]